MDCNLITQSEADSSKELKEIMDSGIEFRILEKPDINGRMFFYPQRRASFLGMKYWVGMVCWIDNTFYDDSFPSRIKYMPTKSKALGIILEYVRSKKPIKVHSDLFV